MKTMPNSTQEEKYLWIKSILEDKIIIKNMAEVCPFSEKTLKLKIGSVPFLHLSFTILEPLW